MKKIITLSTRYSIGGAQMNAHMLASEFKAKGHDASAWFLMKTGELDHGNKVPIKIFEKNKIKNPIKIISLFINLYREIKLEKPDVILGFHPLANILGSLAARASGSTKFIATQRNPASSQSPIIKQLEMLIGCTSLYSKNIAVSHAVKSTYSQYPKIYQKKLTVIHNGLPPLPKTHESQDECRNILKLPAGKKIVGSLGRLAPQKNPEFLIKILPHLPNVHLAFAGEGPNESIIREKACALGVESRVHLIGAVSGINITRFLRSLDVFLLPSHYEGFGRTLVEAMQERLPIVAHDLPVTREVTESASILKPLNEYEWASAIKKILEENQEPLKKSAENQSMKFSLESMTNNYLNAIMETD
ncbi:glycosyltransferase family 4 protein [Pseudomonas stutzeri]|nr:glycosyltransferase family 4 protein [Stutzerimonas stutzeri]